MTTAPSWVAVNSVTGGLTLTSTDITSNSFLEFYIDSTISGVTVPIKKLIKLLVVA